MSGIRVRALDWLVLMALLAGALALRLPARDLWTYDLKPRPDALEYAAVARGLVEAGRLTLEIGGAELPSRYPPGTPLLLAPALAVPGAEPWHAHVSVLVLGAIGLALLYALARGQTGTLGAAFAVWIAVVSPTHVHFSVLAMSEVPSFLATVGIVLLARRLLEAPAECSRGRAFLTGLAAGLAPLLRYPNVLLGVVLVAALAVRRGGRRPLPWLLAGALLGGLPLLVYNYWLFGAFWHSGYRFWEPNDYARLADHLSPAFLRQPAEEIWKGGNLAYYLPVILGLDRSLVSPLVPLLAAVGMLRLARRPQRAVLGLGLWFALVTVLFYGCYFFRAVRLLIVLLPFFAVFAGAGLEGVLARIPRAGARAALATLVFAAAFLLSWGADGLRQGRGDTLRELYTHRFGGAGEAALPQLQATWDSLPGDALVIVDLPLLLLEQASLPAAETLVLSAAGSDLHVQWAYRHSLVDRAGRPFRPPALLGADGALVEPVYLQVTGRLRSGGRAFLVYPRQGTVFSLPGVQQQLGSLFRFEPVAIGPAVGVVELKLRDS